MSDETQVQELRIALANETRRAEQLNKRLIEKYAALIRIRVTFAYAKEALAVAENIAARYAARRDEALTALLDLRQQVEDTVGAAQTDEVDGWITAYHFKTGAIHRLLAEARDIRNGEAQPFRTVMPPKPPRDSA